MRLRSGYRKIVLVSPERLEVGRPPFIVETNSERYYAETVEGSQPFEMTHGTLYGHPITWFETYGWLELTGVDDQVAEA